MSTEHREANRIADELRGLRRPSAPVPGRRGGRPPSQTLDAAGPIFEFMQVFFARNDQLPSLAVIAQHFGYASPGSAHWHVLRLEKLGKIERNEVGKFRFAKGAR